MMNRALHTRCKRCRARKPANSAPLMQFQGSAPSAWREAMDPSSNQLYYYNTEVGAYALHAQQPRTAREEREGERARELESRG